MKKILLLLLLCSGLFANNLCTVSRSKVDKSIEIMIIDLKNNDINSLRVNYEYFKVWIDMAIMNCDGAMYYFLLDTKSKMAVSIGSALNER